MSQANEPVGFSINLIGDFTGDKWFGKFEAKVALSHRDRLTRDRLRREYLGSKSEDASDEARATAVVFSELHVRLTKWPEWWVGADGGMELKDLNLISEIYRAALKVENDYIAELSEKSEAAKKVIETKAAELDPDKAK